VLGYTRRPRGRRVALFSNGSGPPQLALDLIGPDAAVLQAKLVDGVLVLLAPDALADMPAVARQLAQLA
ncbi:hypothetical protein, partial [Bordetella pertussis]|uniref:hypothetical protein n=1 Tax=Bordetella pertussis TaxID=520 RepID=UPI0012B1ADF7